MPVILLCLALLYAAYAAAENAIADYNAFCQKRDALAGDRFFGSVYVDGVLIEGLTMNEARQALAKRSQAETLAFSLALAHGDSRFAITSEQVPLTFNTEALLQQAYTIGRSGSLEQRYRQISSLTEPIHTASSYTYDHAAVRAITDQIAAGLTYAPKDAAVVAFDVANRGFGFSPEQPGQRVDADALYNEVIAALDARRFGEVLSIQSTVVQPALTREVLQQQYGRIASYTTDTTSDSNRNTNIRLAAEALNGRLILPGGTISFNETTGERTPEKGYLKAGAIENGRTVQETGGGVCQVSTTLFNALVRANCEIVTRRPHAWPSSYVPRGEDASVDWPRLDLVMRNASDTTMFIAAWYENRKVTVEVFGLSLGEGVSIELESETTYTKKPTETVYTYNPELSIGTTRKLKDAHTGYSVQTYKIWMQDGVETSREPLYKTEYAMISETYEYNDGNPPM
ncbi:MAG: VanW family protein [Oscillospiraceae bacterium]|nr:VanW family protein [Oscillospiraceae bacterium]